MDIPSWISALAAMVSTFGAGMSWWRSNKSKAAREKAERDRIAAEEAACNARRQVAALDEIAASVNQAALEIRRLADQSNIVVDIPANFGTSTGRVFIEGSTKSLYVLKNDRSTPLMVERVYNREEFARIDLEDRFTVPPFGQKTFLALGSWGMPVPDHLVVGLVGQDQPLPVAIPRR